MNLTWLGFRLMFLARGLVTYTFLLANLFFISGCYGFKSSYGQDEYYHNWLSSQRWLLVIQNLPASHDKYRKVFLSRLEAQLAVGSLNPYAIQLVDYKKNNSTKQSKSSIENGDFTEKNKQTNIIVVDFSLLTDYIVSNKTRVLSEVKLTSSVFLYDGSTATDVDGAMKEKYKVVNFHDSYGSITVSNYVGDASILQPLKAGLDNKRIYLNQLKVAAGEIVTKLGYWIKVFYQKKTLTRIARGSWLRI